MLQGAAGQGPPPGGGGGRDSISDLPDDLRHHIFSFVPAWEVVRTSALSRQWRHFWASVPCLDIHYPCGCRDDDNDEDEDQDEDEDKDKDEDEDEDEAAAAAAGGGQDWYAEFVKHLLLKRRSSAPVDTLRLRWNHDDANTWIAHAVRRKATHIELSGKRHHPVLEPEYWIFLYGNLKILQLSHLRMNNDDLSQLCSRCTSLEELELQNVDIDATHIRSTSLKRLSMVRCFNRDGLSVDTPNLVLLRCIRPHNFIPGIENSGSLLTATIMHDDCCLLHGRPPCSNCADAKKPRHSESQSPSDCNRSTTGSDAEGLGDNESQSEPDDDISADSDAGDLGDNESQAEPDDDSSPDSDAEDLGDNESQAEPDDDSSPDSDAEELGDNESQAEPDDDSSPDSDAEKLGDNESQAEPDDDSFVGSAEHPDNIDDDGETADVIFGEDDYDAAGSDAEDPDNSDDDDDGETASMHSSEDGGYYSPTFRGHGILRSLSNVITLNLPACFGQLVLRNELEKNCPEFRNLRTLSVGEWCTGPGFNTLSTLLGKSPNLENLFIHLQAKKSSDKFYPRERSFTCNNLKVKILYAMMDGTALKLNNFLRTYYSTRQKRKAVSEAEENPAKQRKVN